MGNNSLYLCYGILLPAEEMYKVILSLNNPKIQTYLEENKITEYHPDNLSDFGFLFDDDVVLESLPHVQYQDMYFMGVRELFVEYNNRGNLFSSNFFSGLQTVDSVMWNIEIQKEKLMKKFTIPNAKFYFLSDDCHCCS